MNKYLISFVFVFLSFDTYGMIPVQVSGGVSTALVENYDFVDFNEIKSTHADVYQIANSGIFINDLADWQNWNATDVVFGTNVSLYIKNLNGSNNGERLEHVASTDVVNIIQKDTYNLYKITLYNPSFSSAVFLKLVRETDYEKVFGSNDARGVFIENVRACHPDDKMVVALDKANDKNQIESVMDSSYHFNPIILMKPVKTLNRIRMIEMFDNDVNFGANIDFIRSDNINNYGGRAFIGNSFDDLYFRFELNLNSFSYSDDFNDFSGFSYSFGMRAKYYLEKLWFDGILGLGLTSFDAENIYNDGDIQHNPRGVSEYGRVSVGYDMKIEDVAVAPFVGVLFQKNKIMGIADSQINLHSGMMAKYGFVIDGIKYVYGANIGIDDKLKFNTGVNIGFVSVVDDAGANLCFDVFQDDIGTSYKLSFLAKVKF